MNYSRDWLFRAALLAFLPMCAAQTVKDLADLSIEELMSIPVTSAARKPQTLRTTAAAAFVITAEDIRRSGIRLMPELLRLAPGVQVARLDAGNWAISIRGLSSDFSNKLLVLVDGRSIYNEEYGGVFWDASLLPVDDIDRIEVIRGPGAALWGTNAVHGVINILTKSSKDTLGGMISGEAGTGGESAGVARYGGRIGANATYRVTAAYNGERRLASSGVGILPASGYHANSLSFRLDWAPSQRDTLFVTGTGYGAADGRVVSDPTLRDPAPPLRYGRETSYQGQLTSSWQRVFSEKSSMDVRFSFEHMDHNELYVPLGYTLGEFNFEHRWIPHPRHEIVWGVTYRNANYHLTPTRSFNFQKLNWDLDVYSAFAADDVTLVKDRVHLILGMHAGHNEMTGMEYQPTARLLWTPSPGYTTWAAVSRAVRTPSIIDRGNNAAVFIFDIAPGLPGVYRNLGSPDFRSEPMMSYELGQRLEIRKNLSLDGSAFLSTYQREGSYVSKDPVFVPPQGGDPGYLNFLNVYENSMRGKIFGTEASVAWSPWGRWKLLGGYSWLRNRLNWWPGLTGYRSGDNPSQQFQARSQLDLTRKIQFDVGAYFYGSTPSTGVGRYLRGDVRLGWRPTDRVEFNVGVRDALDPQHPEQYAVRYFQAFQVRRNVYGDFTWRF